MLASDVEHTPTTGRCSVDEEPHGLSQTRNSLCDIAERRTRRPLWCAGMGHAAKTKLR